MGREGGSSKDRTAVAVINERLLRQGIQIEQTGPAEDDRSTRGHTMYDQKDRADTRRAQAQQMDLHLVKCLVLSYQSVGRIDNIVGVDNITKLHLDNNRISKIENLGHLKQLVWLDLSFNNIQVIEGLDELTMLEDLSLYSNDISTLGGLDKLTQLKCLSLGKNKISDLEHTATYLHKFDKLRMLTLQGNKIETMPLYKDRIIAFSRKIKFLDNRLITQSEVDRYAEEQREVFMPQEEEDTRKKEEAAAAKIKGDEDAEYTHANCPNPLERGLYTEISTLEPEGQGRVQVRQLLEVDHVRERVKEILDSYKEDFMGTALELATAMKDLRASRDRDTKDFYLTMKNAKTSANEICKKKMNQFEMNVKRIIPFGLKVVVDYDSYGPEDFDELKHQLFELQTELLEVEADIWDSFEAVIARFEDDISNAKVTAQEQLAKSFDELRDIEKKFGSDIKRKLDALSDDRQLQQQQGDAGDGIYSAGLEGLTGAAKVLDNKDEYQKLLTEWSDLHIKRLDETEEAHKKREDQVTADLHQDIARDEHARNRQRVSEIHAYVQRMSEYIENHAQQRDV